MHGRDPEGNYAACMEALIAGGAKVPKDIQASPEVMTVIVAAAKKIIGESA
jgi:hypothetical protein